MATIKLGQIVSDIRGKLGGVIFSRNKGGSYAKTFKKPVNPRTPDQQANRGRFGTLMSEWRALSSADQDTWVKNAANYPVQNKVGETLILTGPQLYAKMNMVLLNANLARISQLPPHPVDLVNSSANQSSAKANPFTFDSSTTDPWVATLVITIPSAVLPLPTTQYVQVYASNQVSKGINSPNSVRTKLIGSYALSTFSRIGSTDDFRIDVGPDLDLSYGLGPTIYNPDSRLVLDSSIFDESEGYSIPLGVQFYDIVDNAP